MHPKSIYAVTSVGAACPKDIGFLLKLQAFIFAFTLKQAFM
jgi:hypothetical protein